MLKYSDYRKTKDALAASSQELTRAKAELDSCRNSCEARTRFVFVLGLLLVIVVIVGRRG
jgi:hypothetical protein